MQKDIETFISSCRLCLQARANHKQQSIPHPVLPPAKPWDHVVIDEYSGLVPCDQYDAVLSVVDVLSRCCLFFPMNVKYTAAQIGQLLGHEFMRRQIGMPRHISCDRGPTFTSKVFHAMLAAFNVTVSHSTTNTPQSQGIVERIHEQVAVYIRMFTDKDHRWPYLLDSLAFSLNSRKHPGTGFAPFEILHGYIPNSPALANLTALPQFEDPSSPVTVKDRIQAIEDIRVVARDNLQSYNDSRIIKNTPTNAPLSLQPGDMVFVHRDCVVPARLRDSKGYKKTAFVYHGPFRVDSVSDNFATIDFPSHVHATKRVNFRHLRKYDPDPVMQPAPLASTPAAAEEDTELFYVERITQHKGIKSDNPLFLVKWKGYDSTQNSWEPISSFRFPDDSYNPIFLNYIKKKKLKIKLPTDDTSTPSSAS